jgi:serine/threonine protein kinase/tetratricopeptide (TPR) repeat protein
VPTSTECAFLSPGPFSRLCAIDLMIMSLTAGERLGPYEILAPIGKGGMGEVYRAHDRRTGRDVAIKVSAGHFNERFDREVRAVAALNHPNICMLFDAGANYLVMELVDGAPIAPTDDIATLLDQAVQMADGMTAAHAVGITHRDLKPGNILVTRGGRVKILDFGLAQVTPDAETADPDPTLTIALTAPGTAIGTAAYMSPEQARGQKVDARSDLWSLGVILYEMATGTRPFEGQTAAVVFEGILGKSPLPARERNPRIPVELDRIITRLLEKDREMRYQSAADVRADLKRVERDSGVTGIASTGLKSGRWPRYAIAAGTLALIAGGTLWWQHLQASPLTDQDVLVLADFTNTTGDPAFDGALRQALAFELEQSPFLKIMDDQEVNQTLQLMGRPAGQRITNDIAHEVCVREGQKATIGGSIASLGTNFQIALQAINCQTGATLAREQAEAEGKEHVLKAVAKAATGMRAKLGESLTSLQKTDRSRTKDEVTTNSLEALKAFQLGFELVAQGSFRDAIPDLQRAVELDPNFASAHMFLGIAYNATGQAARRNESFSKAFALIDRVSERERLMISGEYYQQVTLETNKALDAYQVLVGSYPRFADGRHSLGAMYTARGEYEKALEQHQEEVRLEPRNLVFLGVLAGDYVNLDRFDEAKAVVEKAFAQKLDGSPLHQLLLRIAYIQDDYAAQEKEIQWFAGKEEIRSLTLQALNALVHGQGRKAKDLYQQATELARRQGSTDAQFGPSVATLDAVTGHCEAAQKEKSIDGLLLCGDPAGARLLEEQDAKTPPENPNRLDRLYQRGEFQEILEHKGRNWGPYYSLSYLGLARAAARAGDTAKAKRAYQDFLALWRDADKDAPYLIQATKELGELR